MLEVPTGGSRPGEAPALNALNEKLRDDYIKDAVGGRRALEQGSSKRPASRSELTVPHKAFNRKIGPLAGRKVAPDGRVVSEAEWDAQQREWLPTEEDRAFVASLMGRVASPALRQLDRAAGARHQQPAGRLRVRALQLNASAEARQRPLSHGCPLMRFADFSRA